MTLETGLTALTEGTWELGAVLAGDGTAQPGIELAMAEDGDEGLDDVAEVEDDAEDAAGDGTAAAEQRLSGRPINLSVKIQPATGPVLGDHAEFANVLNELRKVLSPLPDRTQTRLLRWRRPGEPAKRIAVLPATGRPLQVPGDWRRIVGAFAIAKVRLAAPNPIIESDELHSHTFTAGSTATITNDGSITAVLPTSWQLTSAVPVTLENVDFDEYVRFPVGPVTVSQRRVVDASGSFGIYYGPGGTWFPRWPLIRPGDNEFRASAACTLSWRDSW